MQIYADEHAAVRLQVFYPGQNVLLTLVKIDGFLFPGEAAQYQLL